MDLIKNKRLKRGADYSNPTSIGLYDLDDKGEVAQYRGHVSREAAHIWLHGNEGATSEPGIAPTVDEMIDAVAAQLKAEMVRYMEWALDSEDALRGMYRALGSKPPMHIGTGSFRLTRAKW